MLSTEISNLIDTLQSQLHSSPSRLPTIETASSRSILTPRRLSSRIRELDLGLGGGLPRGSLVEWGAPMGRGGRELLIPWIREVTQPSHSLDTPAWVLWAYATPRLTPYAPAWAARGIALERLRFAQTAAPLTDLHPVFMEPLFRMIILDVSHTFTPDEYAFITRQARLHDQVIIVMRDHFLSPDTGNIWARIRLNTWLLNHADTYRIEILKGSSVRHLDLALT